MPPTDHTSTSSKIDDRASAPGGPPSANAPDDGPLLRGLARAERYLGAAQALADTGTGPAGDRWVLAAAALADARHLLDSIRPPGRSEHLARRLPPTGPDCARLIQMAITQLQWLPAGPHGARCAQACGIAWVALNHVAPQQAGSVDGATYGATGLTPYLGPDCFPADREKLMVHAVRHHAPPPVIDLLHLLPAGHRWENLAAVATQIRLTSRGRGGRR